MNPQHKGYAYGDHNDKRCCPQRIVEYRMDKQKPDADRSGPPVCDQAQVSMSRAPASISLKKITGDKNTYYDCAHQATLEPRLHPVIMRPVNIHVLQIFQRFITLIDWHECADAAAEWEIDLGGFRCDRYERPT